MVFNKRSLVDLFAFGVLLCKTIALHEIEIRYVDEVIDHINPRFYMSYTYLEALANLCAKFGMPTREIGGHDVCGMHNKMTYTPKGFHFISCPGAIPSCAHLGQPHYPPVWTAIVHKISRPTRP